MTDKPIIFSAPMVRALLDGRKTQTRRLLKQQPVARDVRANGFFGVTNTFSFTLCDDGGENSTMAVPVGYQVGDRLWVKEAWRTEGILDHHRPSEITFFEPKLHYEADGPAPDWSPYTASGRYRHARFMPRWASRLTLTVTDMRVQRLQEISEADAVAEGVERTLCGMCGSGRHSGDCWANPIRTRLFDFRDLWSSLHGPDAWGANPWVVALTFDVHRGNIDQIGGAA